MNDWIAVMKENGWYENLMGKITHDVTDDEFDSWWDALVACIEVGSGS